MIKQSTQSGISPKGQLIVFHFPMIDDFMDDDTEAQGCNRGRCIVYAITLSGSPNSFFAIIFYHFVVSLKVPTCASSTPSPFLGIFFLLFETLKSSWSTYVHQLHFVSGEPTLESPSAGDAPGTESPAPLAAARATALRAAAPGVEGLRKGRDVGEAVGSRNKELPPFSRN